MIIFIFLLFSYPPENFSFSVGISTFPGDLIGYEVNVSYHLQIEKRLTTASTLGYTKNKYSSHLGTNTLNCEFSRLYFTQCIEKKVLNGIFLSFGISINALKNWVIETNRIGSFKITDYYALNDFAPGFTTGSGLSVGRGTLSIIYDFILINEQGENIFYNQGNIHTLSLKLSYSLFER
ncbi:hypothetical protein KAX02_11415 [candidate division WOR-3 bacterium]|nr:hypothetical protein [candidate division WOR-3 bacterium]